MPADELFKWPPNCELCLSFEDEDTRLSRDRSFDLYDATMRLWPGDERTIRFGVLTTSKRWVVWDEDRLEAIEQRIRHDLGSDGARVAITRLTEAGRPCAPEFVWQLDISEA